ncbi:hypothetical protein KI387_011265, partial [Taxus chinensis]
TIRAEAALTGEEPKKIPLIRREEVLHGKYLDLTHQKEVYQETMDVIRNFQGKIQCLKDKSQKLEHKKSIEVSQKDMDEVRD